MHEITSYGNDRYGFVLKEKKNIHWKRLNSGSNVHGNIYFQSISRPKSSIKRLFRYFDVFFRTPESQKVNNHFKLIS